MSNTSSRYTVRPATPADAQTIASFNTAMALETEDKALDPATALAGVEAVFSAPARGTYLVACAGADVIGQIMWTFEWSDWRNGNFWWIQSVYVAPGHRRQGVFTQLFEAVRARAASASDSCGLRLYVERHNDNAKATYLALGGRVTDYAMMEWTF